MRSTWLQTLQYLPKVRGCGKVPPALFVARQGGHTSDMFRLTWDDTPVSLQEYHEAFLTNPAFQLELLLLSMMPKSSSAWRRTTRDAQHLESVARGEETSVGPWTTSMTDGDCQAVFSTTEDANDVTSSAPAISVTRIMQCRVHGKPFCDTWWSIEKSSSSSGKTANVELVFGTDIERYSPPGSIKSWLVFVLDPFHNLYSRILLASTAANLQYRQSRKQI